MKNRGSTIVSILLIVFSIAFLCTAALLLIKTLPEKKPDSVTKLETENVFAPGVSAVEPIREDPYEGELPVTPEIPEEIEQPEPSESGPDEEALAKARAVLETMSDEEKIWQMFFVTPESMTGVEAATLAGPATEAALKKYPVGGMIYFARNLETRQQVIDLLSGTQSYSKIPLFLGTDEEGGTVSRVGSNKNLGGTAVTDMAMLGKAGDPAAVYSAGTTLAKNLTDLGFNLDFAPVADVLSSKDSVIATRSFGSDPQLCATMVGIMTGSLRDNGVIPCLKHFPGYGSAIVDDHYGTSVIEKTQDELEAADFVPFTSGIAAGAPFVMVSHLSVPEVTGDDTPADLSEKIVSELLRNKLGFSGVIITDSHEMASITDHYSSAGAAVAAVQAGCDMILMPADLQGAYNALHAAVQNGTITRERIDESVLRILTVKASFGLLDGPEF